MLKITIPSIELFDESKSIFINTQEQTLALEHSLVSISKWEAKWEKPFFDKNKKTFEETVDYIRCMTITQNVKSEVYSFISDDNIVDVNNYIEASMTATTFVDQKKPPSREVITSEVIYYWMVALNIPFECQRWHISRLFTLINICNIKNQPPAKMSRRDILERNRSLNAARRKELNNKG